MDDDDEYDKFFDPIDVEDLPYIATLPPSPERPSQPGSINNSQPQLSNSPIPRPSQKAAESSDEYDEYDFSEFSTIDFAKIDAEVRSAFEIVATGNSVATNRQTGSLRGYAAAIVIGAVILLMILIVIQVLGK